MANIFFISDTHFGHKNLLNFKRDDGSHQRHYTSVEEMNADLIKNWNSVVGTNDKVYHLGDLALQVPNLDFMYELKGKKILYKGNHDKLDISQYAKHFKDIRGADHKGEFMFMLSHIPLHKMSIKLGFVNIHGHLHYRSLDDPSYFNVSVERINYTPIELGVLQETLRACNH